MNVEEIKNICLKAEEITCSDMLDMSNDKDGYEKRTIADRRQYKINIAWAENEWEKDHWRHMVIRCDHILEIIADMRKYS